MSDLLQGKKILVTGASSGLGKATAELFSQNGAKVIVTGRDEERLSNTFSNLYGEGHSMVILDLSLAENVECLMNHVYEKIGSLDAIVHSTGIHKPRPLQALKYEDFDDIFNVNVKSAQFIAKFLRKKGRYNTSGTSLVYLSSAVAMYGQSAISTYAASKAALQGLTKSLAIELAKQNIRVNSLAPGVVDTEMTTEFSSKLLSNQFEKIKSEHPLGLGRPEDVANAALFLASDLSRWITGSVLYVDGGYSAH